MLNNILSWMATFNIFLYTAAGVFTVLTVIITLLTASSRLSAPIVKITCLITNRTFEGFMRLSLILSRAVLVLSCVFVRSEEIVAVGMALVITNIFLYCLAPRVRFILPDIVWTITLFFAVMIKDSMIGYLREVKFDYMVLVVTILACIFIVVFNVYVFLRALSEDMIQCAEAAAKPPKPNKKKAASK